MAPTGTLFGNCECGMTLCMCRSGRTYELPPPVCYVRDPESPHKDKLIADLTRQIAGLRSEVFRLRQENQRNRRK